MNTKATLKNIESEIISALNSGAGENAAEKKAFGYMMKFFETADILDKSQHCQLLQSIYINKDIEKTSIAGFGFNAHVSERTLYRYRTTYIKCFSHLYEKETGLNFNENFDNLFRTLQQKHHLTDYRK